MPDSSAADVAREAAAGVRDDPGARLMLLRGLYEAPKGSGYRHLPYRRAASAFMAWQLRRGLLNGMTVPAPGSPWWRSVNEALLRDSYETRLLALGHRGSPSGPGVGAHLDFIRRPSASRWYRAHNTTVVSAYLAHQPLADLEGRVERFFINVVLMRVLYAHTLVAAPRLAMGRLAPVAPLLGDPRMGMTGIFLSLSRVLPDRYPLGDNVERYVQNEHAFGRVVDVGAIVPRLRLLYDWSGEELGLPQLGHLLVDAVPAYAWESHDSQVWMLAPSLSARVVRRVLSSP